MPQIDFKYFDILWNKVVNKLFAENDDEVSSKSLNEILLNLSFSQTDFDNINKKYLQYKNSSERPEIVNLSNNIYEKLLKYANINNFNSLQDEYEKIVKQEFEQIGFLGRNQELKQLEEFILSDKKIFGIYGVPMIGKSELVNHFIKENEHISNYKNIIIQLNPQPENAEKKINKQIFGHNLINDFSIINDKTVIVIQNFEEVLQWNGNNDQLHSLKENYLNLKLLFLQLIKNENIKLIIESRFRIHFSEIIEDHRKYVSTLNTTTNQLEGIDKEEFWKFYKYKNFDRKNFEKLCVTYNNHPALLTFAYNDVDRLFDNDLLNAVGKPEETTKHLWKSISKTLNRLEASERLILCALTLMKEPISELTLINEIIQPVYEYYNIETTDFDSCLYSLRQKFLVKYQNPKYELNPYVREICYTSLKNNFKNEFNFIENIDFIKENSIHPQYDAIRQSLEEHDYSKFWELIKYERRNKNFKNVHYFLNEALKTNGKKYIVLMEIGITYKIEKKWDSAIETLVKALGLDENNFRIMTELGICYRETNQLEKAIIILEKARKIKGNDVKLLNELAIAYQEDKQLDKTIEICKISTSLNHFESYTVLSKTYEKKGELDKALEIAREGMKTSGWDKSRLTLQFNKLEKLLKNKSKMKTIKIFLASSSELIDDRKEFEIFISRKNKEYIKDNIFLELILWEDFIDAISQTRLQDEYNKAITECDIFVSLFHTKVGKFTEEEFIKALETFKVNDKPIIYTYFKDEAITMSKITPEILSLLNFKQKLNDLGHFFTIYNEINDLKHKFNEQLIKIMPKLI